jgi:hypothetical protein
MLKSFNKLIIYYPVKNYEKGTLSCCKAKIHFENLDANYKS